MTEPIPGFGYVKIDDFSRQNICDWAEESGFSTFDIRNNIQKLEKFARLIEFATMDRQTSS